MSIKSIFNIIRQKLWGKIPSTTSLCASEKTKDSPALLTKIITLKTSGTGEFSAEYHGLDYHKIRGYTVVLNINDYHWMPPNSSQADMKYDAWVSNSSIVIKVDLNFPLTHGRTVHFVINYVS